MPSKSVRFAAVVEKSGRPEPMTLWQGPEKDKRFKKALAEQRLMTIKQENAGTKKDFGLVGFWKDKKTSYLLFPRSLRQYEGKRVIGIKYDLVALPDFQGPAMRKTRVQRAPSPSAAKPKARPRFRVAIQVTAIMKLIQEVEAENKHSAKDEALRKLAQENLDFSRASRTEKILKVERMRNVAESGEE